VNLSRWFNLIKLRKERKWKRKKAEALDGGVRESEV